MNNILWLGLAHCQPNGVGENPGSARGCLKGTRGREMDLVGNVVAVQE